MPTVVGVKIKYTGKTLSFDPAEFPMEVGDGVVVTTSRGTEFGQVVSAPHEAEPGEIVEALKPVQRVATEADWDTYEEQCDDEDAAKPIFRRMVAERGLDMKPLFAEWLFDRSKLVFHFVSEERVDFRDLVKDMATEFHTRIEMRQIGVRDEARMVGGYSHCGEQLCCARFGGDFQPVSIRMAKEQDLPLNPVKISGVCGRLMCCLRYEFEAYKDFKQRAPRKNAMIDTPDGPGKVVAFDTPREVITVRTIEGNMKVPLAAMSCGKGEEGCNCPCKVTAEALEEFAPKPEAALMMVDTSQIRQAETMQHPEAPADAKPPKSRRRGRGRGKGEGAGTGEGAQAPAGQAAGARQGAGGGGRPEGEQTAGEGGAKKSRRRRGGRGRGGAKPGGAQGAAPGGGSSSAPAPGPSAPGEGRKRRRSHGPGEGGSAPE